jgi:hypothetical protein
MREIRKSGSEGGAGQTNVPFLPLSGRRSRNFTTNRRLPMHGSIM